jgi:hypothetical protein
MLDRYMNDIMEVKELFYDRLDHTILSIIKEEYTMKQSEYEAGIEYKDIERKKMPYIKNNRKFI